MLYGSRSRRVGEIGVLQRFQCHVGHYPTYGRDGASLPQRPRLFEMPLCSPVRILYVRQHDNTSLGVSIPRGPLLRLGSVIRYGPTNCTNGVSMPRGQFAYATLARSVGGALCNATELFCVKVFFLAARNRKRCHLSRSNTTMSRCLLLVGEQHILQLTRVVEKTRVDCATSCSAAFNSRRKRAGLQCHDELAPKATHGIAQTTRMCLRISMPPGASA